MSDPDPLDPVRRRQSLTWGRSPRRRRIWAASTGWPPCCRAGRSWRGRGRSRAGRESPPGCHTPGSAGSRGTPPSPGGPHPPACLPSIGEEGKTLKILYSNTSKQSLEKRGLSYKITYTISLNKKPRYIPKRKTFFLWAALFHYK